MKYPALSVWQPWASMLVSGVKNIENRVWYLPEKFLNTPILIHTSKKKDQETWEIANHNYEVFTSLRESLAPLDDDCYKFGGVIGWVIFDKVITMEDDYPDNYFWFDGTGCGFHIKEFHETEFFPCRGQQKIFYVDLPEDYKL